MYTKTGKGKDIPGMLSAKIPSYASLSRPVVLMFNLFTFFNQLSSVKSKLTHFIGGIFTKAAFKWVCYYLYQSPSLNPFWEKKSESVV